MQRTVRLTLGTEEQEDGTRVCQHKEAANGAAQHLRQHYAGPTRRVDCRSMEGGLLVSER